jgi:uncharacterized SAM-binding protein YcdF (DUF218 family)
MKLRRTFKRFGAILVGIVLVLSAAFFVAPTVLCVDDRTAATAEPGESIVVLGGDPRERVPVAAKLFAEGRSKRLLVSGTGDCFLGRDLLVQRDVPLFAIHIECDSRTTKENAQFATQILREQQARKVIIVTSWYHSRRALAAFRHFAPEIEFTTISSREGMRRWPREWRDAANVFSEYVKIMGYAVRWGIWSR